MTKLKLMSARKPTVKRKNDEAIFAETLYNQKMRRFALFTFSIFVLLPFLSFAEQTISAGFPERSIWTSKENPAAGEQIEIFTAIRNGSEAAIRGKLVFTADGKKIAAKQFELAAGKTGLESVFWKAEAGTHKLAASIEEAVGAKSETLSVSNKNAGEIEITAANPAPPTAIEQSVKVIGAVAKDAASASIPIIASAAKTAFQATESFRRGGIKFAENQLSEQAASAPTASKTAAPGKTAVSPAPPAGLPAQAGAQNAGGQNGGGAGQPQNGSFFSKLSQLAAPAILFTFGNRAIFYPFLVLLLLGLLYLLGRMVNKPRY